MKNKLNTKYFYISFAVLFGILSMFLTILLCIYTDSKAIIYSVIAFSVLVLLLNIAMITILRKKILLFTDGLSNQLEKIINEDNDIEFDFNTETLFDKIGHKLQRLYEILNNNKEQMQLEKQEVEKMISDISHQIKTPLANLKMYNETMSTRELPINKTKEFHQLMEHQIDKLDFLISSMLKVSRLETGTIILNVKDSNLYDTVANALSTIVVSSSKKNITVTTPTKTDVVIPHDSKWTAEAIFNILDNAVKYTPNNGSIKIEIEKREMTTKIEITDTGKGILEENYSKIFKRFFREQDVSDVEGIGIGLHLTREIISKQKGYLQVNSIVGKGSIFQIILPNEGQ